MSATVSPWQLLQLYQLTITAGVVTAAALAWLGAHLAAQARSAQTLCVGQGASLGVLIGMVLVCQFQSDEALASSPWPWLAGSLLAAAVYAFGNRLNRRASARNVNFIALFAVLWSLSPLLSGLFPKVDDHLTQVYFGDLVTLSERNSELALAISSVTLLALWRLSPRLNALSFDAALTGSESYLARRNGTAPALRAFEGFVLVLLCFSIQFLGLLFTLGCLFVPTVILARGRTPGVTRHFRGVILVASLGCLVGFFLSLTSSRLSTVPTVLVCISAIAWGVRKARG